MKILKVIVFPTVCVAVLVALGFLFGLNGKQIVEMEKVCCDALSADCFACEAGVSVETYCQGIPGTTGCPVLEQKDEIKEKEVVKICCAALSATCIACSEGVSEETYCAAHPQTTGCPVVREKTLEEIAKENGWFIHQKGADGSIIELVGIDENGEPIYYVTN